MYANKPVHAAATIDGHLQEGMTLREHYAGLMMQGLLARHGDSVSFQSTARIAIDYADTLISELSR